MKPNEFKKIIKDIRTRNNLTQKDLSRQYDVSPNTISNWENGKSLPDEKMIKKILKDYEINVSINSNEKLEKNLKNKIYAVSAISFLALIVLMLSIKQPIPIDDFDYKALDMKCDGTEINSSVTYDNTIKLIYLNKIDYCKEPEPIKYQELIGTLYIDDEGYKKEISNYDYQRNKDITIKEYLEEVFLPLTEPIKDCLEYKKNKLYLEIIAKDKNNQEIKYKVNLSLDESCE